MRLLGYELQSLPLLKPGSPATRPDALPMHVWVLGRNLSTPSSAIVYSKSLQRSVTA